ncbi:MAG: CDP-glycerol glycerophosphotransferase family protein [Lachnospiraceae bacterium]|nr:CDP-glycerol glycerophosphotransferase family protein [Lachnospiraceae bacterium]
MNKIKFQVRQYVKMFFQYILLPFVYQIGKRKEVRKGLIILADAHHAEIPDSMEFFADKLEKRGYEIRKFFFESHGINGIKNMVSFMKSYAEAEYVVLCDYFLPVASCKKREETIVVQLWHACGLLKKCGYSTPDDIPPGYRGDMFRNYDLLTVSGEACREAMAEAMRLPLEKVQALGVSRTDIFWKKGYQDSCKEKFYELHQEAEGKKIVMWAPTFRGKASQPYVIGQAEIEYVKEQLGEGYYLLSHLHPHIQKNQQSIMELLPVVDILITDYSSVVYEFILFEKPIVLFVPDYEEYERTRGFCIDIKALPVRWAQTKEELLAAIRKSYSDKEREEQQKCKKLYMSACDGHATERILDSIGLTGERK